MKMMKSKSFLILLAGLLFVLYSCEEDFDLTAPYKDITVVYGLIDLTEDTTYLRINKAFLGEGNVLEMAKVEDSSVYNTDLAAVIEEWSNGNLMATYQLDTMRIDTKEDGLFYNPYQLLYYAGFEVNPDMHYKLKVEVKNKVITGETYPVNDFSMTQPSAGSKFIQFRPGLQSAVEWNSAKYGRRYEVLIRFNFNELKEGNPDTLARKVDWFLGTQKSQDIQGGEEMYAPYLNDAFYALLADTYGSGVPYADPAEEALVTERFTVNVEFIISVGGDELNTYMEVNEPSNSIVQDKPDYTNLDNGLGIFSSRYRKVREKSIHPETITEILNLDLKFVY
jgi:hypothetical protein